jgi:hypothetical protein
MRWPIPTVILPLVGIGGCLYVGGINHEPSGEIQIEQSSARLELGGSVTLKASSDDPDGDQLSFGWSVGLTDLDGRTLELTQSTGPSNVREIAAGAQPAVMWTEQDLTLTDLPGRGTYDVLLTIRDEHGALRTAHTSFEVKNQPPEMVEVKLEVDPDYKVTDSVPDTGFSTGTDRYPGHAHYLAWLLEDDKSINYLENDLRCGGKSTVTWSFKGLDSTQLEYKQVEPCEGKQQLDRLRFRLKQSALTKPTTITIVAQVDDGYANGKATFSRDIDLVPTRPPCILGTDPSFLAKSNVVEGNKVVVYAHQTATFEVTSPSEDVNEGLVYSWWVREGGGAFELLSEGVAGRTLTMPEWFRVPGEELELRVEVRELDGQAPACSAETELCRSSTDLPERCYQWVTWRVRFI